MFTQRLKSQSRPSAARRGREAVIETLSRLEVRQVEVKVTDGPFPPAEEKRSSSRLVTIKDSRDNFNFSSSDL